MMFLMLLPRLSRSYTFPATMALAVSLAPVFWLRQWNREGPRARSRVRVEWGEEGFA